MPVTAPEPPAGALFHALRNAEVEDESAYAAVEEVRDMAGHNVVVELGARIDHVATELGARIDSTKTELGARIDALAAHGERSDTELGVRIDHVATELGVRIDSTKTELGARIDTLASRIDTLQKVLWPLVIAVSVALLSAVGGGLFALLKS